MTDLTAPQRKALEYLAANSDPLGYARVSPRALAKHLWPDSPAWGQRTRGRRTGTVNGAVGGTMPMNAAKVLHRLAAKGFAQDDASADNYHVSAWTVTPAGQRFLAPAKQDGDA